MSSSRRQDQVMKRVGRALEQPARVLSSVLSRLLRGRCEAVEPETVVDPPDQDGHHTATRSTLSEGWQAARQVIDWMGVPTMTDYVNGLVSGRAMADGGHWAVYARDRHIKPLSDRLGRPLSVVSLACGSGHIEQALINNFGWPIGNLLGLELDDELRRVATERFASMKVASRFECFDFDSGQSPEGVFDVVFTCHSIHHATDLEGLLTTINNLVAPGGLIVGAEYLGPTRFQIEHDVRPLLEELFAVLPPSWKSELGPNATNDGDPLFRVGTIAAVRDGDPSEAVRSSDLRTLLLATFPVLDLKPMGGTLLRWLFNNRAGHVDGMNPEHLTIVKLLQILERELIALRRIRSDDLFFVLGKSDRLPG